MSHHEFTQRQPQFLGMSPITLGCGQIYIIGNHGGDLPTTIGLAEEMLSQSGGNNLRNVLMLGEGQNLDFREFGSPRQSSREIMAIFLLIIKRLW